MKVWIIYDGRAENGDPDESAVLECCSSWRDLKDALYTWREHDAAVYEYDRIGSSIDGDGERFVGHMRLGRKALLALCTHEQGERNASNA